MAKCTSPKLRQRNHQPRKGQCKYKAIEITVTYVEFYTLLVLEITYVRKLPFRDNPLKKKKKGFLFLD